MKSWSVLPHVTMLAGANVSYFLLGVICIVRGLHSAEWFWYLKTLSLVKEVPWLLFRSH